MSKKASTPSLSKSLNEGMSPFSLSARFTQRIKTMVPRGDETFDDFAEDTGGHFHRQFQVVLLSGNVGVNLFCCYLCGSGVDMGVHGVSRVSRVLWHARHKPQT